MSNENLMSAFEGGEEEQWSDDRDSQPSQGWGLLNFLSRPKSANQEYARVAPGSGPASGSGSGPTDAVFGNLLAKQDAPSEALPHDDETTPEEEPPTYHEASNDNAPSYWETTIMAPGWYDDVLVDGLPVGSSLQFVANLLFSSACGIGGFIGTYLVHTSYASRTGSVLGLAITLVQLGAEYGSGTLTQPQTRDPSEFRPDNPNSYDDSHLQPGTVRPGPSQPDAPHADVSSNTWTNWYWINMAFAIIITWWAVSTYLRAYWIKQAVLRENDERAEATEPITVEFDPESLQHAPSARVPSEEAPDYDAPSH